MYVLAGNKTHHGYKSGDMLLVVLVSEWVNFKARNKCVVLWMVYGLDLYSLFISDNGHTLQKCFGSKL